MNIITAIIQRILAHHNVQHAWLVIHADESWHIDINKHPDDTFDRTETIANGDNFSELPALLSSLK